MCGIAGYLSPSAAPPDLMRGMLDAMARRGPDSEGQAQWPGVILGHKRLAILDLSPAGHQPMLNEDGRVGIVFNGCIYNFLDLREELEGLGQRFRSNCDTEVLVRGYEQWGMSKMLPKLRGMFAFAIWDESTRTLSMARDRMGVKPLLYVEKDGGIAFASTLGALEHAGLTGELDPRSMLEFIEYGFVPDPGSIFTNIKKLPPGHWMEWKEGRGRIERYWTLPEADENSRISFDEAVEETERLIIESVKLRLQADVPIGALLSGGVDSALVCWAMTKLNANVEAFTIGAAGSSEDESGEARRIAETLGISHEVVMMSETSGIPFEQMLDAFSEPLGSQSAFGVLRVSEAIRSKATVLLTGDGGDDVFLGYPFFGNAWRAQNLARRLPGFAPAAWGALRPLARAIPALRRGVSFFDYVTGGLGPYARLHDGLPFLAEQGVLGKRLRGLQIAQREMPASLEAARRLLSDVRGFHWRMHFTGEFMLKVDGGTMHSSLEARAPFLDHKLWEFAAKLPPALHLAGGELKAILRTIARRRIGDFVARKPKQGFTVPISDWLLGKQRGHWVALTSGSVLVRDGWLDRQALERTIQDSLQRGRIRPGLWHLLALEHWMRRRAEGS